MINEPRVGAVPSVRVFCVPSAARHGIVQTYSSTHGVCDMVFLSRTSQSQSGGERNRCVETIHTSRVDNPIVLM